MNNPLYEPNADPFGIARLAAEAYEKFSGIQNHDIALTLGSGWGLAAEKLGETIFEIPANRIVGFKSSEVPGHNGLLKTIRLENGRKVFLIGARTHIYESLHPYHVRAVVHSVRTAAALGCKTLFLTNGAGSVNPDWEPGTIVIINDHINLSGTTPIEGANFIDMNAAYDTELRRHIKSLFPEAPEGVYIQNHGPAYETRKESMMGSILGGDLVGMSTALETIAARQLAIKVAAMSLVTNFASGIVSEQPLNHKEVLETGKANEDRLALMLTKIINTMPS